MLAGLLKGPSFFNPDRHPDRAKERLAYVLGRMQEDGVVTAGERDQALAAPPRLVAYEQRRRDSGLHFVDFLSREAKTDGVTSLTAEPYTVHSTINAALQREAESSLQEGLARFEMSSGRVLFRGPEANLGDAIQKLSSGSGATAPFRPGNGRCRPRGCRLLTCIGSRPSSSTRAVASAVTAVFASASETAA